ncbi:type IV pili twitching motility protein PilT [Vibrio sp. 10N.286.49.C2]|uniref:PilT/PilU family type 4a pilus ATPase n=1 Tax=unclassified Vibrio TaxID=2614977 RepID=UPI000C817148|nr:MULTISPECIES: PilT/PilU family type 4a pilus ATPase [unclassified Vibrio]PMH34096.1 type IV pili twitching motility protein PilT [Vibrio sp. 10N.286.49.C2]PMH56805.1 type IV pili twitching motility protein PilT [Vibrio sp. 10N.286.49.B1]PMH83127.1 type IV pili twitching motility protein PilT [Vibrio sp. 10N.286.48.B7]
MKSINIILDEMWAFKASDLYITVGAPVLYRVDGELKATSDPLSEQDVSLLISSMMNNEKYNEYSRTKEANFAIILPSGRFRVSAFFQRELPGAVIRRIETNIPSFEDLALPDALQTLSIAKRGLVLIVGATGSGKSTTMAAMTGYRNQHRTGHILTVEDPIEFVHEHQKCIITQREVGLDTESYCVALKNSLRQAPDMILIGEIRTREAMEYAVAFAETGHLCMATLHANNASQAIERIIHLVPKDQREQLLFDLSSNLKGILGQQLIRDKNGRGRHGVFEVLLNSPRISELIRKGDLGEIKAAMSKSREIGMQTFDQALFELVSNDKINYEDAIHNADSANNLRLMLKLNNQNYESTNALSDIKIDMS